MADQTDRLALDTYSSGESGWSHTDTIDWLDEHGIERDTVGNRPASGTYDDELFYATDEEILYQWDSAGSTWDAIGGPGSASKRAPGTFYREAIDTAEVTTDEIDHYSGANDPDADLDTAISNATAGDIVYLPNGELSDDRTITTRLAFVGDGGLIYGSGGATGVGTKISGSWTFDEMVTLSEVRLTGSLTANTADATFEGLSIASGATVTIDADQVAISDCINDGSITFKSTTSGGYYDGIRGTAVTDNGSNS